MENVTQETIDMIVNNFGQYKMQIDKIDGLVSDLNNCKSEYTKGLLVNYISKISEQVGLKDKIFSN